MLTAKVKIQNQWNRNEVELKTEEIEFTKISDIEDYIAYNRAYIREIEFSGKFTRDEE
jgi:DNA relaxase NicK